MHPCSPIATGPVIAVGHLTAAEPASGVALVAGIAVLLIAFWLRHLFSRQTRELRASEERFRALFDNAIEGIYERDMDGHFRRANPALARILGYRDVEALLNERKTLTYVSPSRGDEFFALLGASNHLAHFESEIRRADGTIVWISENVRALRDDTGRVQRLQGFVSDISARKRAESALRTSEERFRVLFEHSPIGIVEYDYRPTAAWLDELRAAGVEDLEAWFDAHPDELQAAMFCVVITGTNAAALRLVGAGTFEEGVANLPRIFTAEAYVARRRTFVAAWNGRNEAEGEFTLHSLDGTIRRVHYHWWTPMIDGRPSYERTQLALLDLTEARSAERELAEERERLSVTLRAMAEGVITTDTDGLIRFMNEAACELTGWAPEAATGRALEQVCQLADERGTPLPRLPVVAAVGDDHAVDLPAQTVLRPHTGGTRRVEGRCAPMHDTSGRAIGAVLVLRDVTERSRMELELMRASKMESIGVLAGGIAHDFNNLLAVVMGNLTLALLDERVPPRAVKWLRDAERGTLRARELTQQLLTFAKGGEPVRSAVLLPDIVREAAEFALHGSTARCEFNLAEDMKPADADKGQIGQVVQNLVINAVQAMPEGGVIRIDLCNEELETGATPLPAGDYVRLEISDSGRGIAREHLARIFEPFFTTKEYGTGLGLATVYSVIRKHKGHITVESELGAGTTFRMWLPAAHTAPVALTQSSSPFQRLSGRVLFMDDEAPIRAMTGALLERLGLEPTLASDGTEAVREYAVAHASGRPFHAVVMDLTVPGSMGGAEAMREILKIDPDARGIVSSGYSSDPVMANFEAHGFRGMVPKPYRIADFARTLREVMLNGNHHSSSSLEAKLRTEPV
jgi:PAS domain S-box-containing protein